MVAALLDLPRLLLTIVAHRRGYLRYCNRHERLAADEREIGFRCQWRWTSELNVVRLFPFSGRWLLRLSDSEHSLGTSLADADESTRGDAGDVGVSFIIGHRGMQRLPLLLETLRAIRRQRDVRAECIVVEQDERPQVANLLPRWVRYVHAPLATGETRYSRAAAFNVGAALAHGRVLILHDNDLVVPVDYAAQALLRCDEGFEIVNLKRYIFYLSARETERVLATPTTYRRASPEAVLQNALGGGSIAVTCDAYRQIGGMDETFIGWGGEDNEFWDRALTRRVWHWGYMPLVHLWHPAQPRKQDVDNPMLAHYREREAISPLDRIAELIARRGEKGCR